jgi:hypothetical protein
MRRKLLTLAGFAAGAFGGTALYRRRVEAQRERIELYYGDGSMVSLPEGTAGAERLLPLARAILATART